MKLQNELAYVIEEHVLAILEMVKITPKGVRIPLLEGRIGRLQEESSELDFTLTLPAAMTAGTDVFVHSFSLFRAPSSASTTACSGIRFQRTSAGAGLLSASALRRHFPTGRITKAGVTFWPETLVTYFVDRRRGPAA